MITVSHLHKQFKLYSKPSDRLKEILVRRFSDRSFHHVYEALKDVSFRVEKGETLGILGKNGAGKSTLLKIITGVLLADGGHFEVEGKITGLLELGTGFDADLTGLQNITANGLLIGMTRAEIEAQKQAIIEFSELGEFIHEPVRTYSSGMVMRLAFSIAMHANPACFVVDEALSVGDAHFQQKCMQRIKRFRQQGGSIIFVSHDLNAVKMLCDRAIVLDDGKVVAEGVPEDAVNHYNRIIAELDEKSIREESGYGSKEAEIVAVSISGEETHTNVVSCGEQTRIEVVFKINQRIKDLTIGIVIRDRFGQDIYGINSNNLGMEFEPVHKNHYKATFELGMEIFPGKYTLTAALHSKENHIELCYHWRDNIETFEVAGIKENLFVGVCRLATKAKVELISNNTMQTSQE